MLLAPAVRMDVDIAGAHYAAQRPMEPLGFAAQPAVATEARDAGGETVIDSSAPFHDDQQLVLPRGTRVRIIGNHRTKGTYIGQTAVIRASNG